MSTSPLRHLPVRPNLQQLRHQAKDLLKDIRQGAPEAVSEFAQSHPRSTSIQAPKLADVQLALARSYGVSSWPRLVLACNLIDAIWRNDTPTVTSLVLAHPYLLTEDARGVPGNWGPPLSYAATVGRDEIVNALRNLGSTDIQFAFERACLKGNLSTARSLFEMGARPKAGSIMGACETLNADGLQFLLDLGAPMTDAEGDPLAPIGLLLQTYTRNAKGKHRCFDVFEAAGIVFQDTPCLALHRGNQDALFVHLQEDPALLTRQFAHEEIYPPTLGCSPDPTLALHGTPLSGGTLLHLCVDFDEFEIARWILANGGSPDAPASVDTDGFGGHTPLFGTVVSQPFRANVRGHERFTTLLLEAGANPKARASLYKELRFVEDETRHNYLNVTPREWGETFHDQDWVNPAALELIRLKEEVLS